MARKISQICAAEDLPFIFKASYDKANRTSVRSYRGMGAREGCALLGQIGREIGMPVTTDVHSPNEAEIAAEFIDVLQIPAFLCRQTDLIRAAAETGRVVNVKKGQFLAPWDVRNIAEKLDAFGAKKYFFTERGTTFGYNNLVADMRSIPILKRTGCPVIFDATHSVQLPGGGGDKSGGQREFAPVLARAALAAGANGLFIETHPQPDRALSDGPNMIPLAEMPALLRSLVKVFKAVK
jgi:2-dehydro-3-deoxyphosphooctonate aldolase (KDO 8-P synthase)